MTYGKTQLLFLFAQILLFTTTREALAADNSAESFTLFQYLTATEPQAKMVAYTPLELDPRVEANNERLATKSIRADLEALRSVFDGLILYGYHEACTPRILAVAHELRFRAVIIGIWNPKSAAEVDGVAALVNQFEQSMGLGIVIGNEGIQFNRYEADDVKFAAARLRLKIPAVIPLTTSEPLGQYKSAFLLSFGDFLAPNIHPVFDQPQLSAVDAARWTREKAVQLAQRSKKPVLVKETGFPHGGKDAYTPTTQSDFWSEYLQGKAVVQLHDFPGVWVFHGVAFEAFDLAWKTEASGLPIEKCWGMLSARREPHPAFQVWSSTASSEKKNSAQ